MDFILKILYHCQIVIMNVLIYYGVTTSLGTSIESEISFFIQTS